MKKKYSVKLSSLVEKFDLKIANKSSTYDEAKLYIEDMNRPALQLAGFYTYFDDKRIQIVGRVESTYLETLSQEARYKAAEELMKYDIPAVIVCHGMQPFPECLELSAKYDRNLFVTPEDTSTFMADAITYLRKELAPRTTAHGVLVDVYGEGVLITGDSGIGKSETALELIKRGHRLIADDAVEIRKVSDTTLEGSAPAMIRHYMELRGIGIVDVRHLFGVGSVKPEGNIDLCVHFAHWENGKMYDRLGVDTDYKDILGVQVPSMVIPVQAGRNLAVILELAAMNNRQKKMGYNAALALVNAHDAAIDGRIGF